MSPWVIVTVAVIGVLLLAGAVVLGLRSRKKRAPPKTPAPSRVWRDFVRHLPLAERRPPLVVVLGPRLAGKSTLIRAGMGPSASPPPSAGTSPSQVEGYAGRGALVQEIAGDLLDDGSQQGQDVLRALWASSAAGAPLVVCVLDTSAGSWTPAGLHRLGKQVREKIDVLTATASGPPRVRIALTHLDVTTDGFLDAAALAQGTEAGVALTPAGPTVSELAASLAPLERCLTAAIATSTPPELSGLLRFYTTTGPRLVTSLAPFVEALATGKGPAPPLDGVVLAALSPDGALVTIGGAIALDTPQIQDTVERDVHALDRRRAVVAIGAAALASAVLVATYAAHYATVRRAEQAEGAFAAAIARAKAGPEKTWSVDRGVQSAEASAATAIDAALEPLFPPLRIAFPARKAAVTSAFLQGVRDVDLLPATRDPSRAKRAYALTLLYAASANALGGVVRAAPESWATGLAVPSRAVTDYVSLSRQPWTGVVPPPSSSAPEITLDDWRAWLVQLDDAMGRRSMAPEDLARLQERGRALSDSMADAVALNGLQAALAALVQERGPGVVDTFVGRLPIEPVPRWVTDNRDALDVLLHLVTGTTLDVPSARGKSLRSALDDLASITSAGAAQPASTVTLALGGDAHTYRTDVWAALVRTTRAVRYARAFADDVRATGRSPFFVRADDYAPVRASGTRVRGPQQGISGLYTAAALGAEVKPPLDALDSTLDAAGLSASDRASLVATLDDAVVTYASSYHAALSDYVNSYRIDVASPAGLRAVLEDMVAPGSFFATFWGIVAENANVDGANDVHLAPLVDALAPFQPVVSLMAGEQGKHPMLDQYGAIVASVTPSLDAAAPAGADRPGANFDSRLSPLGKLGLAVLEPDKPAPMPQVIAWLDSARLYDPSLRQPFTAPIELAYTYALQSLEASLDRAYRAELRPLVAPFLARFPFDRSANEDASPEDLVAVVGPKGSFRDGMDTLFAPVCDTAADGSCVPRAPAGFRAVRLPGDAAALWAWSVRLGAALWDDGGKPKAASFRVRPRALPEVKTGDVTVATLSFLRAGATTAYGFNQTPSWQTLTVSWSTPDTASTGVERVDPSTGEKASPTMEGQGDAWRFYRLLCMAKSVTRSTATWALDPPIAFEIKPDPWALVVPAPNRDRRCAGATEN